MQGYRSIRRVGIAIAALSAMVFLSACGGGGGSGTSGAPYNRWGLRAIKVDRAYAQLELRHGTGTEPGDGQTVGLIDSGIDTGHPVFAGKRVTERFLTGATNETGDKVSHGTAVASVIAGRPSASFTAETRAERGVAWGADLAMFALRPGRPGSPTYNPIPLTGLTYADDLWAPLIGDVTGWSSGGRTLDFVNVSVGFHGIIEQYSAQQLRDNFRDTIAALAQAGPGEKTVFVFSAGNAHGRLCDPAGFTGNADLCVEVNGERRVNAKSPDILSGLPARISEAARACDRRRGGGPGQRRRRGLRDHRRSPTAAASPPNGASRLPATGSARPISAPTPTTVARGSRAPPTSEARRSPRPWSRAVSR